MDDGLILISSVLAVNKTNNSHSGEVYILVKSSGKMVNKYNMQKLFYLGSVP